MSTIAMVFILGTVGIAIAQNSVPPTLYVNGRVEESPSAQPVPGVVVSLTEIVRNGGIVQAGSSPSEQQVTRSGENGAFKIAVRRGQYRLRAWAEGFVEFSRVVEIGGNQKVSDITVSLVRMAGLSGRLFDARARTPVTGITLNAVKTRFLRGKRLMLPSASAVTDTLGNFSIDGLPPGEYLIEITPRHREKLVILRGETAKAESARDLEYRRSYYPGNSYEQAFPITLFSGTNLNLGDVVISKEPLYQIIGKLPTEGCTAADAVSISLTERLGLMRVTRAGMQLPCGSRFMADNLAPGTYELRAWISNKVLSQRTSGYAERIIQRNDSEVSLAMVPPLAMKGRVQIADVAGVDRLPGVVKSLRVELSHLRSISFAEERPVPVSPGGEFEMPLLPTSDMKLAVTGLPPPYYIKDVLYNGTKITGRVFGVNVYAPAQSLQIVLGDDGAQVRGTVKEGPEATVAMIPWPMRYEEDFPVFASTLCDASGAFEFGGVAPGVYRIVPLLGADKGRLDEPNFLASLAGDATDVIVGPRDSKSITLVAGGVR